MSHSNKAFCFWSKTSNILDFLKISKVFWKNICFAHNFFETKDFALILFLCERSRSADAENGQKLDLTPSERWYLYLKSVVHICTVGHQRVKINSGCRTDSVHYQLISLQYSRLANACRFSQLKNFSLSVYYTALGHPVSVWNVCRLKKLGQNIANGSPKHSANG